MKYEEFKNIAHTDVTKKKYTDKDTYEIVVVDNASTDGTQDWLKKQKSIKCHINLENVGFPKGCNQGI